MNWVSACARYLESVGPSELSEESEESYWLRRREFVNLDGKILDCELMKVVASMHISNAVGSFRRAFMGIRCV